MAVRVVLFALVGGLCVWGVAAAQPLPAGPEFQVNTYEYGLQRLPRLVGDSVGNLVIVWQSDVQDGSDEGIIARRYSSAGAPLGGEFQVNTDTFSVQRKPAVAASPAGDFVVAWEGNDGFSSGIAAQRFTSIGAAAGAEFQVNTFTTAEQRTPAVAVDGDGDFVVVWASQFQDDLSFSAQGVFGQRYTSAGVPAGAEFQVNTYTTGAQFAPAVAANAAGDFVVVWMSQSDGSGYGVFGQRYTSAGVPAGGEFQVNTYTTDNQYDPAIAANAAGDFVVVWESMQQDGDVRGVFGQRYTSAGAPAGGEFQVNTYTTGIQYQPVVSLDAGGDFVVVWTYNTGSGGGIFGQRYASGGAPDGGEFEVTPVTSLNRRDPAVAIDASSAFTVAWTGYDASTNLGISARQFLPIGATTTTSSTLPPTDLLPGRIAIVQRFTTAKFVAKPTAGDTFAPPTVDPIAVGGTLRFFDTDPMAVGGDTYSLPAGLAWKGLGNPPGSKGYKYHGAGSLTDPCKVVLIKPNVIKGLCKSAAVQLTPPFVGDIGVVLSLGTTDQYCARFGGDDVRNDPSGTRRKNAPAPLACP